MGYVPWGSFHGLPPPGRAGTAGSRPDAVRYEPTDSDFS